MGLKKIVLFAVILILSVITWKYMHHTGEKENVEFRQIKTQLIRPNDAILEKITSHIVE